MMDTEEESFPKFHSIPRRYRLITITEKLDGSNGLIRIGYSEDGEWSIRAGSRNRWITTEDDNYGFAKWVLDYNAELINDLGVGDHYGEWWGGGIQRKYGLKPDDKRFSLFNSNRWSESAFETPQMFSVPIILQDVPNSDESITRALYILSLGSLAVHGFMDPEGIVIWDQAARINQKVTLKNDELRKSLVKEEI